MRKFLILLLAGIMMFSLSACGGDDDTDTEINSGAETNSETETDAEPETDVETETSAEAETEAETEAEVTADGLGYIFEYNGVSIIIDAEAADIIEALGEPNSYYEASSCAFDGLDKIYTYSSFELDTYPMDDTDYVSAVFLKDDLVSTAEGISIGDSLEAVTAAYGEGEDLGGYLVYEKDDMELRFIIEDDAVKSIIYQTTVLE